MSVAYFIPNNADNVFENTFGPVNWSFNYGQCHFIGINNITYTPQDKANYKREVSESTLEWLRQDLSFVPKDRLVILSMHAPSQRRDQPYSTSYLTNCEKLYDALDGYKVVIMSGHLHHNYTYTVSGSIVEHNHASLMGNDWDNNAQGLCNDGSPRGFTVYRISGNSLSDNYYKGAVTDRSFQMRLYAPGEYEQWEYKWEIKWIDYKSLAKVSEMYDKIPDVGFKDLKPFDWDDDDWYDDDALNELSRFRREKMYLSSFVSKISSYVDDLDLYMADSIRVVWWIDC